MHYAVVGGGIAATSAVRSIRRYDPDGAITLVNEEQPFYYRPMIPLVVAGSRTESDICFRDNIAGECGVRVILSRAVSLDVENRELTLTDGAKLAWDRLCIATGASPRSVAVPGGERARHLRSLRDALELSTLCGSAGNAVVIGGGFVGIKTCEALLKRGLKVTVVEEQEHILRPRVDAEGARIVQEALMARGARFFFGDPVTEIRKDEVLLSSGATLSADIVVTAIGARPNVDWLTGSGVFVERGVRVDENLQTTAPGVYAAGDVVEGRDLLSERKEVSALWSTAAEMGKIAGSNMAGEDLNHPAFLSVLNATEVAGIPMVSVGDVVGDGEEVYGVRSNEGYRKLVFQGDRLRGVLMMGNIRNGGIYASFVRSGNPLSGHSRDKALNGALTSADLFQGSR